MKRYSPGVFIESYVKDEVLLKGLHQCGVRTVRDLLNCRFKELMGNSTVMANWDKLQDVIMGIHTSFLQTILKSSDNGHDNSYIDLV